MFINYAARELTFKIVYYGAGLCGKTANLQWIYDKSNEDRRGRMVSLETESDRTLFFDFLPLDLGKINGFQTRFQLYTVPGQVFYNASRKLILRSVDGVCFVVDSQLGRFEANLESLESLHDNLDGQGYKLDDMPNVIQYNKRDMEDVLPISELSAALNPRSVPEYEAVAVTGEGVFETLKGLAKLVIKKQQQGN